ncbi:ACP S-malonyltransferase [Saccharibacillus sacchari]|uniref:ACP S-malonyltransferase n=1 Tax=Saccharibacillus sacchari TaxID=456493 RepID=A0ACC6PJJ4_9BACL
MTTYVFPGQGSQYKGMGNGLFEKFPEITRSANRILGYSIEKLCLHDEENNLGKTQYTQPALYTVNALSYLDEIEKTGRKPDYLAGHSLGEYNALFAARAINFETGLELVKYRGELMSHSVNGAMIAILGMSGEEVEAFIKQSRLFSLEISNYNAPSQIVVGGSQNEIQEAILLLEKKMVTVIPLKVSGAFHTSFMNNAREKFEKFISRIKFNELRIPVISNVTSRPHVTHEIQQKMIEQITSSVRWTESIQYLIQQGEVDFQEIGPGRVLAGLVSKIQAEYEPPSMSRVNEDPKIASKHIPLETKVIEKPSGFAAESLGDRTFKEDYGIKYAYLSGAMYKGIASVDMVVSMAKEGMLGFFGTGGLTLQQIELAIQQVQQKVGLEKPVGFNLLHSPAQPESEEALVNLYLKYGVKIIDASAFMNITPALVLFKAKGLEKYNKQNLQSNHKIIAKISRPEVAEAFLSPAPERILNKLLVEGKIETWQAEILTQLPVADDLCVEADSGGHTDQGVAYALMPAIIKQRDRMMDLHNYKKRIRVGAAGGIGTPEAAAAAFILGADFIMTGSINQCTVEANTSESVKELLSRINVQDTDYAPAGDMFEMGAKVQVLKRGVLFPARANKLYDLYQKHNSIDEIDHKTQVQIQEKYFKRSFSEVFSDCCRYYSSEEIEKAERNAKYKMAMIFKWYFAYSTRLALQGIEEQKVDYQVHCGPALGAFNQWVKGTRMEEWNKRHVSEIGLAIMTQTAELLQTRINQMLRA